MGVREVYAAQVEPHKPALALATAAWLKLLAITHEYQSAVMRGAEQDELERIRREAHDTLDANLDQNGHAATHARALLGL